MCGFVVVLDNINTVDQKVFLEQLEAIKQRGPDDFGVHSPGPGVYLGSRRLSVQDISSNGHMPMSSIDGKVSIVFNGEIYNYKTLRNELISFGYKFISNSDTEVLLYSFIHWGQACLSRLDGMFAFVISDYRDIYTPKLFAGRDRAGEKPLYLYHKNSRLILSSELSPIMIDPQVDKSISIDSLHTYLGLGYIPAPSTILIYARKLLPGHSVFIDINSQKVDFDRYWQLPDSKKNSIINFESCSDTVFDLLKQSVADRLVADVPLGIFLSGGIDSSLITAAAAEVSQSRLKTFTIVFPNGGTYDERKHASIVSKHFYTDHYEIPFTSDGLFDEMIHIMGVIDEPMGDSSILPTSMLSRATRELVTVALGGDGGDELFGGYQSYSSLVGSQPNFLDKFSGQFFSKLSARIPLGFRGRDYFASIGAKDSKWFSRKSIIFNSMDRSNILFRPPSKGSTYCDPEDFKFNYSNPEVNLAESAMRTDFQTYLSSDILTKVDRASMSHSLEVRCPFLSNDLIDYSYSSVPIDYKVSSTSTKIVLKEIASRRLPKELLIDRKQGFSIPPSFYNSARWQKLISESIENLPSDLFNQNFLFELSRKSANTPYIMPYFFPIIILSAWFQRFRIQRF
jgi:asparagine synthase (glutamine-hydrolysing)